MYTHHKQLMVRPTVHLKQLMVCLMVRTSQKFINNSLSVHESLKIYLQA